MPVVKVYVHFVWTTKNRFPHFSTRNQRNEAWRHIRDNARDKGIFVDFVGGWTDHCHCLVSLGIGQNMSDVMRMIKGESSFWINKNKLCSEKFEWQDEYYAVSVSVRGLDKVREYIKNQEEHHQAASFREEYETLMRDWGFGKFG